MFVAQHVYCVFPFLARDKVMVFRPKINHHHWVCPYARADRKVECCCLFLLLSSYYVIAMRETVWLGAVRHRYGVVSKADGRGRPNNEATLAIGVERGGPSPLAVVIRTARAAAVQLQ